MAVVAAGAAPAHASQPQLRILYAGDWTGSMQIFAADPSGRAPLGQVTFDSPGGSCYSPTACGFTSPLPSPDGRRLAYWTTGTRSESGTLLLANADGTNAREIGAASVAAWSPDSRVLAYATSDGVHTLAPGGADRIVVRKVCSSLRYSPDGTRLAMLCGGDVVVLRAGHARTRARGAVAGLDWSPDGRRIAYGTWQGISEISPTGGRPRVVYQVGPDLNRVFLFRLELAFSPGGRYLAFALGGIRMLDTQTGRVRLTRAGGSNIAWEPDGSRLLFVPSGTSASGDSISTGDVQTVTPGGHIQTVISAAKPYGGQIVATAWTTPAAGVHYRSPQPVDGTFAGGPVQEIAADGGRVAFIACGGVSVWTPATGAVLGVERAPECDATYSRHHVYSLGLAGGRLAWLEKGYGLCFQWDAREATLGSQPLTFGHGFGCLGSPPPDGIGTAVGAGSLLVVSHWTGRYPNGALIVDEQTIERVDPGGCPCPAISSSPGPYTPLDVDGGRIVASGENETRILAADGRILLLLTVPTLAAQLSGSDLVLAAGREVRDYDAATGTLRAAWPLPVEPAGHDCDLFGDPTCEQPVKLTLGDVARGFVAYVIFEQVYVLRLADGAAFSIGPGRLARFMDAGLVYADGARIHLVPWARLPLTR
jgi:Tol biopolymer transport system component